MSSVIEQPTGIIVKSGHAGRTRYTFVEQVRRHGADPFAYFEWVFEKLMHNPAPEELELNSTPAAGRRGY